MRESAQYMQWHSTIEDTITQLLSTMGCRVWNSPAFKLGNMYSLISDGRKNGFAEKTIQIWQRKTNLRFHKVIQIDAFSPHSSRSNPSPRFSQMAQISDLKSQISMLDASPISCSLESITTITSTNCWVQLFAC